MKQIKVGGRELALDFTMDAMDQMEVALGEKIDLSNLQTSVVDKTADRKALLAVLHCMTQPDERGERVTLDWLKMHVRPGQLVMLRRAVLDAMTEGMSMETEEADEDEEVDVVLEEIKKNDSTAG